MFYFSRRCNSAGCCLLNVMLSEYLAVMGHFVTHTPTHTKTLQQYCVRPASAAQKNYHQQERYYEMPFVKRTLLRAATVHRTERCLSNSTATAPPPTPTRDSPITTLSLESCCRHCVRQVSCFRLSSFCSVGAILWWLSELIDQPIVRISRVGRPPLDVVLTPRRQSASVSSNSRDGTDAKLVRGHTGCVNI